MYAAFNAILAIFLVTIFNIGWNTKIYLGVVMELLNGDDDDDS